MLAQTGIHGPMSDGFFDGFDIATIGVGEVSIRIRHGGAVQS